MASPGILVQESYKNEIMFSLKVSKLEHISEVFLLQPCGSRSQCEGPKQCIWHSDTLRQRQVFHGMYKKVFGQIPAELS